MQIAKYNASSRLPGEDVPAYKDNTLIISLMAKLTMHDLSIIYTTISSHEAAEALAKLAVESKLAACVNIIPNITSIYQWENKIEKSSECALIFKTAPGTKDDLLRCITDNHPYSIPAIIVTSTNTTADFFGYVQAQTPSKNPSIEQQNLLSHTFSTEKIDVAIQEITFRINQQGDKPYATIQAQLEILEQLSQFEFGQFLILNRGINGYWTHYMLTHQWVESNSVEKITSTEQFILESAPTILATQQRFEIFLQENQTEVKNGAKLACIPCGMMGELLYLNFESIESIQLIGLDYDPNTLIDARSLATKLNRLPMVKLHQGDAWQMTFNNEFDLISSNGLNIYEPDEERVTQLYQVFYNALKPGGKLVTSFLTPPPTVSDSCEWDMAAISQADLLKQKIIFVDILEAKWQCFRTSAQTQSQLESVGFERIEFIYDKAKLFPTVVAYKK
jgi:uncharacterized protein involved in tolerance to divalent cations/SAM-dependent methyltransferase